jgi:transposase
MEPGHGSRYQDLTRVPSLDRLSQLDTDGTNFAADLSGSFPHSNANQVFKWRRAFERGELADPIATSAALLPVTVSASSEASIEAQASGTNERPTAGGAIHIEFPGVAMISVESGADPALLRSVLESLLQ